MKRLLLLLLTIMLCIGTQAQVNNDLIIEHLEKMSENAGEEYSDYSELLESYWNISENPVNINSDNIDQLTEMKFISKHVNNSQYIQLAAEVIPEGYTVNGLRVEYKKAAVLGDILTANHIEQDGKIIVGLCDEAGSPYAIVEFTGE